MSVGSSHEESSLLGIYKPRVDGTGLNGALIAEGKVPARCEESDTCGVGVGGQDINHCFLREVAAKSCILIGVGEESARKSLQGSHHSEGGCVHLLFHFLVRFVKELN